MTKQVKQILIGGIFFCAAVSGLTACGSSSDSSGGESVVGRVTSISDTEIQIETVEMKEKGGEPDGASGGAIDGKDGGQRPDGDMPDGASGGAIDGKDGGQRPDGASGGAIDGKDGGEKPDGDMPDGASGGAIGGKDGEKPDGASSGETKVYTITSKTKIYKQDGDEKTEITADEIELGGSVTVTANGDTATEITVQEFSMNKGGKQD
jgi:hypothetical protein